MLVGLGTLLLSVPVLSGTATADARPVPGANPDLSAGCGLDVSLVLDRSGSITDAGAQGTVTDAGQVFVDGLTGTGSEVKVVNFGTDAVGDAGVADLDRVVYRPPAAVDVDQPDLGRMTNWDDALEVVRRSGTPADSDRPGGDLVIVVTDGNPTARNETVGSGDTPGDGHEGDTSEDGSTWQASEAEVDEAVREANWLKADGSHLFVVAVTDRVGVANIRAITDGAASLEYVGEPDTLARADFTRVGTHADLAAVMRRLATGACTLRVAKVADTDPETAGLQTGPAPAGATVRYEVAIENTTPQEVTVTSLRDVWGTDAGGEPVAISGLDCGGGSTPPVAIAPAAVRTCAFTAALPEDAEGTVSDHVEVEWWLASDGPDAERRVAGAGATVTVAPPLGVAVAKTASPASLPAPGGDVTHTVVVENASVVPVTLTDLVDHAGPDTDGPVIAGFDVTHCDSTELAASDGSPGQGPDTTTCAVTSPTGERAAGAVVEHTTVVTVTETDGSRTATAQDTAAVTITDPVPPSEPDDAAQPVAEPPAEPDAPVDDGADAPEVLPEATAAPPAPTAPPSAKARPSAALTRLPETGATSRLLARSGAVLVAAGALVIIVGTRREHLIGV